jgi:hypothetical protein
MPTPDPTRLPVPDPQADAAAVAELARPRLDRWLLPALLDWAVLLTAFAVAAGSG